MQRKWENRPPCRWGARREERARTPHVPLRSHRNCGLDLDASEEFGLRDLIRTTGRVKKKDGHLDREKKPP